MVAAGIFRSGTMRPPTVMPSSEEPRRIEGAVAAAGLARAEAAECVRAGELLKSVNFQPT
jgi:hypothetical protein